MRRCIVTALEAPVRWLESAAAYGPPRIPGQAALRPPRRARAHRRARHHRRGGGRRRRRDRLPCVVKAQVQIGGRGKAGGIKVANDRDEAEEHADGDPRHGHPRLHGPRGVDRGGVGHRRPSTTPRSSSTARAKRPLVMLSTQGGMDIEEVAERDPDAIATPARRPAARLPGLPRAAGSRSRPASTPTSCAPVGALLDQALRRVRRRGGDARRGQPADRHRRPRGRRRSTRRSRSTTTRCSATPTTPRCATSRPRTRRSRWRASAG